MEQISEGRTQRRTGTLYGALECLLEQWLITVHREEVVDGRGLVPARCFRHLRGAATPGAA
ncbi:hypothetical protein AB4039_28415 [Streptomyces sp. M-16]|uniref:hypothetical protein n=1 Tax=Streptomyces sp. M-16 TaxID=3233040 RepID=UPI003F96DB60